MERHTLILSTAKVKIPEGFTIDFITNLINRGLAMTEYFGREIKKQSDFIENDMKTASEEITYIEIFFDTLQPIDYDSFSETEIDEYVLDLFEKSDHNELRDDGKDIILYLH